MEKKKEATADFLARMEATYGPQPTLEEIYERRLKERHERKLAEQARKLAEQAREQRRRERLRRFSLGLLGGD